MKLKSPVTLIGALYLKVDGKDVRQISLVPKINVVQQ